MRKAAIGISLCCALCIVLSGVPVGAKTVTDELGRKVRLPERKERIVSLAPSITECLFAIGRGDRLVGVTQYSDYPPQAEELPSVGSYVNLNVEKIVSLKPDLCLATKDGNPYAVISRLKELGIPVFALDPRDLHSVMDTLSSLGRLLDARDQAHQVVQAMHEKLTAIKAKVARARTRPKVFFQIGISPIVSVGKDTFLHELITLAGGVNAAGGSTPYPRYSREDVLVLNPDIILINSMTKDHHLVQEAIDAWRQFPQIKAVADGRIYALDADLFTRPTPRLVEALQVLVHLFHPGLDGMHTQEYDGGQR